MTHSHLISPQTAREFALAGNAHMTFKKVDTGTRRTFQITRSKKNEKIFFVKVLTGPENTTDYTFLGTIKIVDGIAVYTHSHKSPISAQAVSNAAFEWVWNSVINPCREARNLEIWHEGRCCRCGHMLTVPESIESGWGPECVKFRKN